VAITTTILPLASEERLELAPWQAVQDVGFLEASTARLIEAVTYELHLSRAVGVGRNGDHNPGGGGPTGILRREVEPVPIGIDFEEATIPLRAINLALNIDFVTGTLKQQPTCRVRENIERPVVHGPQQALGLGFFV
jgi:hypothetical protein